MGLWDEPCTQEAVLVGGAVCPQGGRSRTTLKDDAEVVYLKGTGMQGEARGGGSGHQAGASVSKLPGEAAWPLTGRWRRCLPVVWTASVPGTG